MTIVLYKCSVCKRDIELLQNRFGLETIQRCIITHGCRGKLYQQRILQDFIRGDLPDDVTGLDNYQQRRILHNHRQAIESIEWIVTHNLGTFPAISVFVNRPTQDDNKNQIEITPTDIIIVDSNIIKLVFNRPESGIAQLVGRASDPKLLQPVIREALQELDTLQATTLGELTIATRTSAPDPEPTQITVELTYTTTDGIDVPITYAADNQPSIKSPWNSINAVIVNGKVFTVRSFNIVVAAQTTGVITNGSVVRISNVDTGTGVRNINANEMIILLADAPFTAVDRNTSQFIDVNEISGDTNPFAFFFDKGELVADETVIGNGHPPIRSI
jgi:hypothetical protein